jgi:hypothetical protein
MVLYDKPVRTLLWGMVADLKPAKGDVGTGSITARPPTGPGAFVLERAVSGLRRA